MASFFPAMVVLNAMNRRSPYAVFLSKLAKGGIVRGDLCSNLSDLRPVKRSLMVVRARLVGIATLYFSCRKGALPASLIRTAKSIASPLSDHISHVIGVCAKKKVVRVDAFPVVTGVADEHIIRHWANKVMVGKAMSRHKFSARLAAVNVKVGVTRWIKASSPFPAAIVGYCIVAGKSFMRSVLCHCQNNSVIWKVKYNRVGGIVK